MRLAFLDSFAIILGEGSLYECLRRAGSEAFDPYITYAGMLHDETGREVLAATHREYLVIGQRYGLPMVAGTPTWHSNDARVAKSAHASKAINADACDFMKALRESYGPDAAPILIAGVTGPFGDGYKPEEAPDLQAAVNVAFAEIGRRPLDLDVLTAFIGNGVEKLVERSLATSSDVLDELLALTMNRFCQFYSENLTTLTRPYPGVAECLDRIQSLGLPMGICTNKPTV